MLALQLRVLERVDVLEPAAGLGDQRIARAVIGIGALHEIIALRKAHDDVAAMRAQRHAHEAGGLREEDVVELLLELVRKQLGELVLEPLALFVRERQIARIGADAQHVRGRPARTRGRRCHWSARRRHRRTRRTQPGPTVKTTSDDVVRPPSSRFLLVLFECYPCNA